jgi:hypothetical protein
MFCPLCKAEFRAGFTDCSDCRIPLVPTKQEADATPVTAVWKGGGKQSLEAVLSALQQANVPLVFREHLAVGPAIVASLANTFLRGPKVVHDTIFEVTVLQSDAERATEIVRQVLPPPDEDVAE